MIGGSDIHRNDGIPPAGGAPGGLVTIWWWCTRRPIWGGVMILPVRGMPRPGRDGGNRGRPLSKENPDTACLWMMIMVVAALADTRAYRQAESDLVGGMYAPSWTAGLPRAAPPWWSGGWARAYPPTHRARKPGRDPACDRRECDGPALEGPHTRQERHPENRDQVSGDDDDGGRAIPPEAAGRQLAISRGWRHLR